MWMILYHHLFLMKFHHTILFPDFPRKFIILKFNIFEFFIVTLNHQPGIQIIYELTRTSSIHIRYFGLVISKLITWILINLII